MKVSKNITVNKSKNLIWVTCCILLLNSLPPLMVIFYPEGLVFYKQDALKGTTSFSDQFFSFNVLNFYYYPKITWYFILLIIIADIFILFKNIRNKYIIISSLLSVIFVAGLYFRPINYVGLSNHVNDESLFYSLALISINLFTTYKFVKISLNN